MLKSLDSIYNRAKAIFSGEDDDTEESELTEEEFLANAREQFKSDLDADQEDRSEAEADNIFANASDKNKEQWDPTMKLNRIALNRPVVQRNLIPTYVQQVVNEGNQNNPSIKITAGDKGTPETAEYLQSRIRQIEYESDASTVWGTARDQQVTTGRAGIRLLTDYVKGTMKQYADMERIPNQFSIVWDKGRTEHDCSDADHVWLISKITRSEHIRRFGRKTTIASMPFTEAIPLAPDWVGVSSVDGKGGNLIQIAERFSKVYKKRRVVKLANGQEGYEDEMPRRTFAPLQVVDERIDECLDKVVRHVIDGVQIVSGNIEGEEFLIPELPVIPLWGREAVVNGQVRHFSLIRQAKDMQRSVNLYCSNIAECIAQAPKTPWIIEFGSIPANHEEHWNNVSNEPRGFMYWMSRNPEFPGVAFSPPRREVAEPPIQALTMGLLQAIDGIKAAMGIFDASLGEKSNESSGIAIQRRQIQSGIVNYHFPNNEARSRKCVGEKLLKIIRKLDKAGGEYKVRDYDGSTRFVPIGKPYVDEKTGKTITHDLSVGEYGVEVETGLNFTSAKAEENARLGDLIKAAPELLQVIGDNYMRTSDFPGAEENADRMKAWINKINPGIIPPDQGEGQQLPPHVIQKIQELESELQTSQAHGQSLFEQLQSKKPELDNKLLIQQNDLAWEREKLLITTKAALLEKGVEVDYKIFDAEMERLNTERGVQAQMDQQTGDQAHESVEAQAAREHQSGEAEASRQHESVQSEASRVHESTEAQAARKAALQSENVSE